MHSTIHLSNSYNECKAYEYPIRLQMRSGGKAACVSVVFTCGQEVVDETVVIRDARGIDGTSANCPGEKKQKKNVRKWSEKRKKKKVKK